MLTREARGQLTVVLVGARNPSNIGAAARAMYDLGFSDLRVVNEYAAAFEAAQLEDQNAVMAESCGLPEVKSAVRASSVMQLARRFDALAEAIADCQLVVGTTAIGEREIRQAIEPVRDVAPRMREALSEGRRVALLFGSEKTGLTNDQLSFCSALTTVPMYQPEGERHLSMNLGQSVAVCLYELSREGFDGVRELPVRHEAVATVEDRERLTQLLLDAMHVTGYAKRYPHNAHEPLVRQLVQQLGTSHREAMTWMGILRQVLRREQAAAGVPPPPSPM